MRVIPLAVYGVWRPPVDEEPNRFYRIRLP